MNEVKILSPQSEVNFVSGWYELANESHFWMKGRLAATFRQFQKNNISLKSPLKGLEIGCGQGVLRAQIEQCSNWIIDGCDLDRKSLENCVPSKGKTFLYNIFDQLDSMREMYDFIILFDVIEHIENVVPFLQASLYHLKPGGYVFINVPALNSLYSKYDQVVGHYRRYDKKMLKKELKGCAVSFVDMTYWGWVFLPILKVRQFLLRSANEQSVVEKGFKPPGNVMNRILWSVVYFEIKFLQNPSSGTSLLSILQKN